MILYDTLLIGAGKIGFGNKTYNKYRSHLYTLAKDKQIKLIGIVDNDKKVLIKISKKYEYDTFLRIKDVKHKKFDLVVISSPTNTHYKLILECLRYLKPKVILIEKPLGGDIKNAKIIKKKAKEKNIKVFVNYIRLSLPITTYIKKLFNKKKVSGDVLYTNGLINNGSHYINLCIHLFGKIIKIKIINKKSISKFEFNAKFILFFQNAEIKFSFVNLKKNFHFIRLNTKNLNLNWEKSKKIELKKTSSKNVKISKLETDLDKYQYLVLKNLKLSFKNKNFRLCTIDECIKTLEVINEIHNLK